MGNNNGDPMKKIWESLTTEEKTVFAAAAHFARIEGKDDVEIPDTEGRLLKTTSLGKKLGRWIVTSGKLKAIEELKEKTGMPGYKCVEKIG